MTVETNTDNLHTLREIERKWARHWQAEGHYTFVPQADRADVFSIDPPIPTISGDLHLGSMFGFTHTDVIARYQRMRGKEVLFPIGWDDNGLPTERLVESTFGVRCDPSLPFDPGFRPPTPTADSAPTPCSRENFLQLCDELTREYAARYDDTWARLGYSVDWSRRYKTIGARAQRVSQTCFLRDLAADRLYQAEAPVYWDVTSATAVAQAEIDERTVDVTRYPVTFRVAGTDQEIVVDVTRLELLPACVALLASADGPHAHLLGATVVVPLFGVEVPVVAHRFADERPEALHPVLTFAGSRDVTVWRECSLPSRAVVEADGTIRSTEPEWLDAAGRQAYRAIAGLPVEAARTRTAELLQEQGLVGAPRPARARVEFFERGERPLEIRVSSQWFVRNGAFDEALFAQVLEWGEASDWYPKTMKRHFDAWMDGLNGDWLISRQRFLGVPFPVWYPIGPDGEVDRSRPILPDEAQLPVDPWRDVPPGYAEEQRGRPGGFVQETDVMETYATSSLTPLVIGHWEEDPKFFACTYPVDLRTHGPDNIRTWVFYSIVRLYWLTGTLPWSALMINGWILGAGATGEAADDDAGNGTGEKAKASKSKGNVVTLDSIIDEVGADPLRYWACTSRPGADVAFSMERVRVGQTLIRRLWSAAELAVRLGCRTPVEAPATEPLDRALLARVARAVETATAGLDTYGYAKALRAGGDLVNDIHQYTALVAERAASPTPGGQSALAALACSVSVAQRLLAPVMPFTTEELWSWWQSGSVHYAPWPTVAEAIDSGAAHTDAAFTAGIDALRAVRRERAARRLPADRTVDRLVVRGSQDRLAVVEHVMADVCRAGAVREVVLHAAEEIETETEYELVD